MKVGFRQSMAWLHTWAGLVVGWLLFAIFVTGTASYFYPEISRWMRPELQQMTQRPDTVDLTVRYLQEHGPKSPVWFITMPDERSPTVNLFWRGDGARRFSRAMLDPGTGLEVKPRDTLGREFFYRFHFELHMQPIIGRWIVGVASMIMFIAIISGIITHRRIFADFFTFRPKKAAQRSWLDGHNIVAVMSLPFHIMITYTGLCTLMVMYMPWGINAAYKGNNQAFFAEAMPFPEAPKAAGTPAPLAPLAPMIAEAQRRWDGGGISRVTVHHPGDANASIVVSRHAGSQLARSDQYMTFNGVTGEVISASEPLRPAAKTYGVLYGLHIAQFAGTALRALFFLSGLGGCLMVASGLVLWVVKRAPKAGEAEHFGLRLVKALNIGAVVGLPIAMACYFIANRLLPVELPARADWEIRVFFAAWILAAIYPLAGSHLKAWQGELWAAAGLFAALPIVNALTTKRHLGSSLRDGDWVFAGFDLMMLLFSVMLAFAAWKVTHRKPQAEKAKDKPRRPDSAPAEAELRRA